MVGAIGWHAGRVGADPAPRPLPRHQSRGALVGHRGGHGNLGSRSVGSGGTGLGSGCESLEGQQSSGLNRRRNVSIQSVSHLRPPIEPLPGNTKAQRAWFRELFERANAEHELHFVDVSDALCKSQLKERSPSLPM